MVQILITRTANSENGE